MRKIATILSTIIILSLSITANALEADFSAKIRGVNTEDSNARVISTAHFKDTNILTDGIFTVAYSVTDNFENVVFIGNASISSTETEVSVGTANVGKITIKHDPLTGLIKTRFVKKVIYDNGSDGAQSTTYNVVATSGSWSGQASITSVLETQEIAFPEQITFTGTFALANNSTADFEVEAFNVRINGVLVASEGPFEILDAGDEIFSITIDTGISTGETINSISIDAQGFYDGGPLSTNTSIIYFGIDPAQTLYNLEEVNLYPLQPQ